MTDLRKHFRRKDWFAEGEELQAACLAQAAGTALSGAFLGGLAPASHEAVPEGPAAGRMPGGQMILALTDRRLVAFRQRNARPKQELVSWDLGEVATIELEKRRVIHGLRLTFTDGSAIELDAGRAGEPHRVVDAFALR
jgi:hypothetical protein